MCHNHQPNAVINNSATTPLTYAHSLHFSSISAIVGHPATCNDCHKGVSAGLHTNYLGNKNLVQLPVKAGTAGLGFTTYSTAAGFTPVGWSDTGTLSVSGTCTNNCHIGGSPAWNSIVTNSTTPINGCAGCHEYPDGNNWTGANGHTVQYDLAVVTNSHLGLPADYNKLTDTYAGVTSDPNKCGKCHSGGAHVNGTVDVVGSGNNYCGTGDFTINVNTTGSDVDCSSVSCHSGKTTPNWW